MTARCRRHLLPLAGLLLIIAGPAAADDPAAPTDADIAEAGRLFEEGNRRGDAGDFAGALELYERAHARYPSAGIQFNIAGALRELRRNAQAANAYQRYLDHPGAKPIRIAEVKPILAALDATLGTLVIKVDGAGTTVQVNDGPWRPVAEARRVRVDAGSFVARARGQGSSGEQRGQVAAGEVREVSIVLRSSPAVTGADQAGPATAPAEQPPAAGGKLATATAGSASPSVEPGAWSRRRIAGLAVGGTGVATIGVGLVAGALTFSKWGDAREKCGGDLRCDNVEQRDAAEALASSARRRGTLATALVGVGAAFVVAGGYLYFTAPRSERPRAAAVRLTPGIAPGAVWIGAEGRF